MLSIIKISSQNRSLANSLIEEYWYSLEMVIGGEVIDMNTQEGFLCMKQNQCVGLITYRPILEALQITALCAKQPKIGIGSALIQKVKDHAAQHGFEFLSVTTTNDNLDALYFYQRRGFYLTALYPQAIQKSRKIKPQIPLVGQNNIALRDEIELQLKL